MKRGGREATFNPTTRKSHLVEAKQVMKRRLMFSPSNKSVYANATPLVQVHSGNQSTCILTRSDKAALSL